ncbi:hypothetical protein MINTMi27_14850 [Mycobacterium intracellulare]|uniref:hypothetical protein n=1 Tax=Mycobacterium intracellulare TaxID=1767 RepID=UPI00192966DA|nr:hypothetical protein [Mycobacterium intracellulare]BCP41392.1 hypothetical protein MINTMi27_14850 [Mycobacterium intracellulare]
MYDKNWLLDVQETKRNMPAASVLIGQIRDVPTRNILNDQLRVLVDEFDLRLAHGHSVADTADKVRELMILAKDVTDEQPDYSVIRG